MIVSFLNIKFTNDFKNPTLPLAIHTLIRNENRIKNLSPTLNLLLKKLLFRLIAGVVFM